MKRRRIHEEKSSIELIEEAFCLLRHAPGQALAFYFLGTMPFLLLLLYFWSDMARSPFAEGNLMPGVLALTATFIMMKTGHALFAQRLLAHLCGEAPPRLATRQLLRTATLQTIVQPIGLFLLPPSLALMVPFAWAYGFFANATLFSAAGPEKIPDLRTLLRKSWQQARLWPAQAHTTTILFKLFAMFVGLNLLTAVLGLPFLVKIFFGIESVFTRAPWSALNSTMLMALAALTCLSIDPLLKATFILRCFYGESLQTGQDLKAELRLLRDSARPVVATALIALLCLAPLAVSGADEAVSGAPEKTRIVAGVSSPDLDKSIEQTIRQREYTWRAPRDSAVKTQDTGENSDGFFSRTLKGIQTMMKDIGRFMRSLGDWLDKLSRTSSGTSRPGSFDFAAAMRPLLFVLLVVLAGVIGWFIFRAWQKRDRTEEVVAEALPAVPDVADENVGADQLPEDGWSRLARELLERGELRLALRAFYLASLASLADRNLITLAKFKSNLEYQRELDRRAHALPVVTGAFGENLSVFERVWYGLHEVTPEMLREFAVRVDKVRSGA